MLSLDNGAVSRSVLGFFEAVEAGALSPEVAAAQALLAGGSVEGAIGLIEAGGALAHEAARASVVAALREHRSKCDAMAIFYGEKGLLPAPGLEADTVQATARFFDDALRISPHASVALHSLGSAPLLQRTTDEILAYLIGHKFLGSRKRTLELGCGSGRMQWATGPYVMEAVGADVSGEMIALANRRRKGHNGVRFLHAPAHRLDALRDGVYDLVFAVDTFPYIVNAGGGIVALTFAEVRRVLRDDGDVVIFKYSYGGEDAKDRDEVSAYARGVGLEVVAFVSRPFRHWDASVFHLRRARPS